MPDRPAKPASPEASVAANLETRAVEAASARSGFLLITGAKLWFLVSATILNLGLPRLLGDTALFGDYGTVNSLISILNMVLVAGVLKAVSKRISERPERAALVRREAIRIQSVLGGGLFLLLVIGAEPICQGLLRDGSLAPYLRIAAVVTLSYAFYAAYIGVFNGLRAFAKQALFDIVFATLKVSLIVGLVVAGFGVLGAFAGFAAAALLVTIGAWWVSGRHLAGLPEVQRTEPLHLFAFMLKVMGFVFAMNVLIQGDVVVLKRALFDAIEAFREAGVAPHWSSETLSDSDAVRTFTAGLVGLYRAAKNVSLLPYQGVIAISFVIFPLRSRASFAVDQTSTQVYVRQALRTSWLLVALVATLLAAGDEGLATLLFGEAYAAAGRTLLPMLVGMSCLALLYLMGVVLTAAGRPMDALWVSASVAALQMVALYLVIARGDQTSTLTASQEGFTLEILARAAWTSAAASALGFVLAAWRLKARLGVPLPWSSMMKGALAAMVGVSAALSWSGLTIGWVFVRALTAGVIFLTVLVVTREVTRDDWELIRSTVLSRRKAS